MALSRLPTSPCYDCLRDEPVGRGAAELVDTCLSPRGLSGFGRPDGEAVSPSTLRTVSVTRCAIPASRHYPSFAPLLQSETPGVQGGLHIIADHASASAAGGH